MTNKQTTKDRKGQGSKSAAPSKVEKKAAAKPAAKSAAAKPEPKPKPQDLRSILKSMIKPLPPPKKPEEAAKAIEWRLLAAVERNGEYLAVIQVGNDKPQPVKEGEALPDGGKLLKARRDVVVVSDAEGNQREIRTYVE